MATDSSTALALPRADASRLQRAIAWFAQRERIIDGAIVVFVGIIAVVAAAFIEPKGSEQAADAAAYALALAGPITLWWRRSHALLALPIACVFVFLYWIYDYVGATDLVLFTVFYSATRHGGQNRRRVWQIVGVCLLAVLIIATIGVIVPTEDLPAAAVLGLFMIHGTAAAIGEAVYLRSQYVESLEQRAAMLQSDLETKTALAAVEERTRIAREMHDIIAHGMSAIVVQAQGAQRLVETDPQRTREVLETIEHIGRDSSDEMRRMLGVLREPVIDPEFAPQPTLAAIDQLVRHAEEAGVEVTVETAGTEQPLPPGLELTAYRIVQEALTNIMRHAGRPVAATVIVNHLPAGIEIEVLDDGLGAAASPDSRGTGHGVLGMRERVEIYDGSFTAGPRPGGGYRVMASLPVPTRVDSS